MPLKLGDVVLLDYTLSTKEDGRVIETTLEDVAREHGLYSEGSRYGPRLVVLGEGELPSGLEEALMKLDEGAEATIELPPERAFGVRDPNKIRVLSARELSARGIVPRVGSEVEVKGERGVIISVGSGRVIVDFNHPLAGRNIVYNVHVVKVVKTPEEKIRAFLTRWFRDLEPEAVKVSFQEGEATVDVPVRLLLTEGLPARLSKFISDVDKHVKEVARLRLSSLIFERPSPAQEESPATAQAAQT